MVICDNVFYYRDKYKDDDDDDCTKGSISQERISKYPDVLVFTDEHLTALGVTDEYIEHFYSEYLENVSKMNSEIKKYPPNCVNLHPEKDLFGYLANANDLYFELQHIFEEADMRVKQPELVWNNNVYYWLGFRPWVRDALELQKFKIYPELNRLSRKSWLFLCNREEYMKYLKDYRRTHPLTYFIYKLKGKWSTD